MEGYRSRSLQNFQNVSSTKNEVLNKRGIAAVTLCAKWKCNRFWITMKNRLWNESHDPCLCMAGIWGVTKIHMCHFPRYVDTMYRDCVYGVWQNEILRMTLQWRHNKRNGVSNHQPQDYFRSRLFRCRSKKTSKLRVTGLCEGNSPATGEFLSQRASNAENLSIWWRHHEKGYLKGEKIGKLAYLYTTKIHPWKNYLLCYNKFTD